MGLNREVSLVGGRLKCTHDRGLSNKMHFKAIKVSFYSKMHITKIALKFSNFNYLPK